MPREVVAMEKGEMKMRSTRGSCLYYPSTTMLVDDSSRFLKHISLTLGGNIPYKLYNDPTQALGDLEKNTLFNSFPADIILTDFKSADYRAFAEKHPISLDISKLHHIIYDPNRFSQVSVVVVDYAMPKMNGLEFCRQLENTAIKKILLTGEADEIVAVEAFNQGLIDKFILKSRPELGQFLTESILQLQKRNFQDLSEFIIKGLSSEADCCINDPTFIEFFDRLCQELEVVEYYLIDTSGSFLFLDAQKKATWLIVKNEDEIEDLVIQATETKAPLATIEALKNKTQIAYFDKFYDYASITGNQWQEVLHPAQKLEGVQDKNYFYAIVQKLPTFIFESHIILPFKDYMKQTATNCMTAFAEA